MNFGYSSSGPENSVSFNKLRMPSSLSALRLLKRCLLFNEDFATGDSIIHHIDPRFKVVAAIVFSTVVAVSYRFTTLLTALLVAIILILAAHLDLKWSPEGYWSSPAFWC